MPNLSQINVDRKLFHNFGFIYVMQCLTTAFLSASGVSVVGYVIK